jgi:hypothetical protein
MWVITLLQRYSVSVVKRKSFWSQVVKHTDLDYFSFIISHNHRHIHPSVTFSLTLFPPPVFFSLCLFVFFNSTSDSVIETNTDVHISRLLVCVCVCVWVSVIIYLLFPSWTVESPRNCAKRILASTVEEHFRYATSSVTFQVPSKESCKYKRIWEGPIYVCMRVYECARYLTIFCHVQRLQAVCRMISNDNCEWLD